MHSLKSLLPERRTKESVEMAKDEVKIQENDCPGTLPHEDSEDYEESGISDLVRVNIDCESRV